ncbi:DUF3822 family protein [Adhaeribacter aquaticus]|uniref:DUF3822 family protein n=1 Tax=Adhaeribacter aquaticus TaxID=299567 RepID=UPI0004236DFE|nr:DUF3822 family protein [Adhaeribacter aquaticus]
MAPETKNYRLTTKIVDETFDPQHLDRYYLYITAGKHSIRFGATDAERNKFILLEDYELINVFTPIQVAQQLEDILADHSFLRKESWKQVRAAVKSQKFTLIPNTLFEEQAAADYLKITSDFDAFHEQVFTYKHSSIDAVNIFAFDNYFIKVINETFPEKPIRYLHQTSAYMEGLLHYGERTQQRRLYAVAEKNNLTILVMRDGTLEFCNIFHYTTPEDFMYFLVFVMQEQKLNPDADAVTIWGDLTHDSALFTLMRKYIRHVNFGNKPNGVEYSYKLEDHFEHRFLDVYSLHFCE